MSDPQSPESPAPRTFRFLGYDLVPLSLSELLSRAVVFLGLALLMSSLGFAMTGPGVAAGYLACCLAGAGVSLYTPRGLLVVVLVLFLGGPFFSAISLVLFGPG